MFKDRFTTKTEPEEKTGHPQREEEASGEINTPEHALKELLDITASENEQEEIIPHEDEIKIGIVVECVRLNVRTEPRPDAPIACEIDCLTELMIDEDDSTNVFYKVFTSFGVEGFCMKKFIAIQT